MHTIWLFYEKPGLWGLKVDGTFETADKVSLLGVYLQGKMRPGASPNAYLYGRGGIVRARTSVDPTTKRKHSKLVVLTSTEKSDD